MIWYILLSWRENADTWFSTSLFVAKTTWFGIPNFFNAEEEWVRYGVKDHELLDGNDV